MKLFHSIFEKAIFGFTMERVREGQKK